ncbi:MAG: D-2-hydroxyacid dehydrogenase [Desulfuromonadaceae bacterium]|nr:D-2-hydroxyacid dehydrogenase [Desulfuromonadaceae bacterium]MDD2847033.1 D-2-hydroxyacid dehydrogenase [Desulfuromonadaceae bacterium]MDD4128989.1 D-2-hydroxyacid dehydrogenase [Desulfuromonadaceae bacterium]
MQINNLLIHLHNSVDSFSLKVRHVDLIRTALPDTRISIADGNHDFLEKLPEADCVMTWVFKPEWYEGATKLQTLFTPAAGHDWVAADPAGRVNTCYGSFHGRIMRESLLAMILHFNRQTGKSLEDQKNRIWGRLGYNGNVALFSQQVLIVGFGALGQSMAELLKAFGAKVTAVKRETAGDANYPNVDSIISFAGLEAELPSADHVVFVLPGGSGTDGIFTARHFSAMKPGAHLYNLGRGNCYREEDLLSALKDGHLAGAGLDVFAEEPLNPASPLWEQPNVVITPHSSAISVEYIDLFIEEWLEKIQKM